MKKMLSVILMSASVTAQAQWMGFIDPNIVRQAGETAATGNIQLNNIDMDNTQIGGGRAPSAAEIAAEIRAQDREEKARHELAARREREQRARNHIEQMYVKEFGR